MGNFSQLPSEIMLDIFSRLPTELVLDCKLVSKTWRKVVRNPSLSKMHSSILLSNLHSAGGADSGKLSFIFRMSELNERIPEQLYYVEYDDEVSSLRVKKLNLDPLFVFFGIIGSCNGLFCLIGLPSRYTVDESTTASYVPFICNPITREVITLPELDRSKYYHIVDFMSYGFGYVASTDEYKVVRLYTYKKDDKVAQIDVYTLGSGKGWRDAGMIYNYHGFTRARNAVFANGFVHWDFGGRTVAYDLANETLVGYSDFWHGYLWHRVLGGNLCGEDYTKDDKTSHVWLLKKKEDGSFGWGREFSYITTESFNASVALTSTGTVLCRSSTKLHLYDLKSSSSKMLEDFGRNIHDAIPHTNTLVSLKAFGEENMRRLEFGESSIEEAKCRDWLMISSRKEEI